MAMNWGAFAGGAANSALNTYSQLNSERMKNLQTALFMEDMAEKQQLKQASQETFGKVGTDQYENINSILEAKGAEVSPEAMAIEKPAAPVQYTEKQAVEDYGKRLSAINPERGFEFKGKALQIKTAQRQSDIDDKFDELTKWRNESLTLGYSTLEGKGMSGMPDVLNPQLKKMGITVEYRGSENGPGSLVAKDDKGKVVGTYTGLDQVKTGFQGLVAKEYESRLVGLLGSADKALDYTLKREKVDLEREKVRSEVAKNQATGDYYKNSLNAIGAPIGKDSDNKTIFQTRKGPAYADGTLVSPDANITRWGDEKNFTPQLSTQNVTVKGPDGKDTIMPVQIVSSMGRDGVPSNKVYDLGGKPIEDPSIIKQIGVKQAPKELSPAEAAALKTYNEGAAEMAKNGRANEKSLKELARILGVTNLILPPIPVPTQQALDKTKPTSVADGGIGPKGGTPKPEAGATSKTAIPVAQSNVALREVQRQLNEHLAKDPARQSLRGRSRDPDFAANREKWEAEKNRLQELLDTLKPGGENYRK